VVLAATAIVSAVATVSAAATVSATATVASRLQCRRLLEERVVANLGFWL
jgi:hypothetical protein